LEALTVLKQPAPVELNATLELAADFAKASTAPGRRRACGSEPWNRRAAPAAAVDIHAGDGAVVRLGAGRRGSEALDEPTSARRLVANHERIQALFGNENGIQ
jgi:hypothetical protein